MKDISESGLRMTTYEFLPLNLKLVMKMPLMIGSKAVQGVCRVVWTRKAGFSEKYDAGVEFVNLNQKDDTRIAKFILHKSTEKV